MATVYIPTPLRRVTGGQSKVSVPGKTIRELLDGLERQYPGMKAQLCDERGDVRAFINVFVNGTEMRQLQGPQTPVKESDEVSIIPAMAGGQHETAGLGIRDQGLATENAPDLGSYLIPNPYSLIP